MAPWLMRPTKPSALAGAALGSASLEWSTLLATCGSCSAPRCCDHVVTMPSALAATPESLAGMCTGEPPSTPASSRYTLLECEPVCFSPRLASERRTVSASASARRSGRASLSGSRACRRSSNVPGTTLAWVATAWWSWLRVVSAGSVTVTRPIGRLMMHVTISKSCKGSASARASMINGAQAPEFSLTVPLVFSRKPRIFRK